MADSHSSAPSRGAVVRGRRGRRIGTVDAVFADYLLVRTRGLLPVDLYVPRSALADAAEPECVAVSAADAKAAYEAWHRPLKQAPHD